MSDLCPSCMKAGSKALLHALDGARFGLGQGLASPAPRISVRALVRHAAVVTGIAAEDIVSKSRRRPRVMARKALAWVARTVTGISWERIGAAMAGRDHTSMMYLADSAKWHIDHDPEFAWLVERLWAAGECEPWGPGRTAPVLRDAPDGAPQGERGTDAASGSIEAVGREAAPGEYVPRHALPPVLAVVDVEREGPVERPRDEATARELGVVLGSQALLKALARSHPERVPQQVAA